MKTISPELALVDEELNVYGRQVLVDFPHRVAASASSPPGREGMRWPLPIALTGCAVLAATTTLVLSLTGGQTRDALSPSAATTSSQETPQPLFASHRLRWRAVAGATFYNVILWRNGERVLDLWPRTTTLRLPARQLASGEYQWFVYPVLHPGGKQRFGPLVARGKARV